MESLIKISFRKIFPPEDFLTFKEEYLKIATIFKNIRELLVDKIIRTSYEAELAQTQSMTRLTLSVKNLTLIDLYLNTKY